MDPEKIEQLKSQGLWTEYLVYSVERLLGLVADISTSLEMIATSAQPQLQPKEKTNA